MIRISNQENALDGIEVGASEAGEGGYGGSGTLGVAFENETLVRRGGESGGDVVDDLGVGVVLVDVCGWVGW